MDQGISSKLSKPYREDDGNGSITSTHRSLCVAVSMHFGICRTCSIPVHTLFTWNPRGEGSAHELCLALGFGGCVLLHPLLLAFFLVDILGRSKGPPGLRPLRCLHHDGGSCLGIFSWDQLCKLSILIGLQLPLLRIQMLIWYSHDIKAYAGAFLKQGAPCNPLTNEGCFAILGMDAFVGLAVLMQVFQLFAIAGSYSETMQPLRKNRDYLKEDRADMSKEMELVPGYTFAQKQKEKEEKERVKEEREQAKAWAKEDKDRRKAAQNRGYPDGGTRNTEHRHGPSDRDGGHDIKRWRSRVRKDAEEARSGQHRKVSTSRNLNDMKERAWMNKAKLRYGGGCPLDRLILVVQR